MNEPTELAKRVLEEDSRVLYGIFGLVARSSCFPPAAFLNEFLLLGHDPCDQDGRMKGWAPFSLNEQQYEDVKSWWIQQHPEAKECDLGVATWQEWAVSLIEGED